METLITLVSVVHKLYYITARHRCATLGQTVIYFPVKSQLFVEKIPHTHTHNHNQSNQILKLKYVDDGTKQKISLHDLEFLFQRNRCAEEKKQTNKYVQDMFRQTSNDQVQFSRIDRSIHQTGKNRNRWKEEVEEKKMEFCSDAEKEKLIINRNKWHGRLDNGISSHRRRF